MLSGPEQLAAWRERRFDTDTEAADYLGIDTSIFNKLKTGTRRAGLRLAIHLEDQAGIPVRAWVSSDADTLSRPLIRKRGKRKEDK